MAIVLNVSPSVSSSPAFLSLQHLTSKPLLNFKHRTFSITCLQSIGYTSSPAPVPPEVESFWEWLCEEGVISTSSHVRPATVTEGLGLIAQRDIAAKEVVLEIPKKLWITPDTVAASAIGNLCRKLKPLIALALFLARENKIKDSPWRIYLDILPKFTDSTLFWSEEELLQLHGTQLLSKTIELKDYLKDEFLKLEKEIILCNEHLFPNPITSDDFMWAFGILKSRAFEILLPNKQPFSFPVTLDDLFRIFGMGRSKPFSQTLEHNPVLIPLADMVNHSSKIMTEDYAEIKATGPFYRDHLFSLWTPVAIKAGEQVFIQYDMEKSNTKLALNYGFTESNSDRNVCTLTFKIPKSDAFFDKKLEIAKSMSLSSEADFDIVMDHPIPSTMLPYLRLAMLAKTEAFLLTDSSSVMNHLESPISLANEMLVCQTIRDVCKSVLSNYSTTIREDVKLLEGGNVDMRLRIAVEIRLGEKRVLEHVEEMFMDRQLKSYDLEYYKETSLR